MIMSIPSPLVAAMLMLLLPSSPLEPTVIDHDPEAYQRWREAQAHRLAAAQPPEGGQAASRAGKAFSWGGMRARSTSDVTDSSNDRDRDRSGFAAYREDKQQGHPGGARGGGRVGERPGGAGGAGGVGDEGGGAVERSASGAEPARVGVLDRLGLVREATGGGAEVLGRRLFRTFVATGVFLCCVSACSRLDGVRCPADK